MAKRAPELRQLFAEAAKLIGGNANGKLEALLHNAYSDAVAAGRSTRLIEKIANRAGVELGSTLANSDETVEIPTVQDLSTVQNISSFLSSQPKNNNSAETVIQARSQGLVDEPDVGDIEIPSSEDFSFFEDSRTVTRDLEPKGDSESSSNPDNETKALPKDFVLNLKPVVIRVPEQAEELNESENTDAIHAVDETSEAEPNKPQVLAIPVAEKPFEEVTEKASKRSVLHLKRKRKTEEGHGPKILIRNKRSNLDPKNKENHEASERSEPQSIDKQDKTTKVPAAFKQAREKYRGHQQGSVLEQSNHSTPADKADESTHADFPKGIDQPDVARTSENDSGNEYWSQKEAPQKHKQLVEAPLEFDSTENDFSEEDEFDSVLPDAQLDIALFDDDEEPSLDSDDLEFLSGFEPLPADQHPQKTHEEFNAFNTDWMDFDHLEENDEEESEEEQLVSQTGKLTRWERSKQKAVEFLLVHGLNSEWLDFIHNVFFDLGWSQTRIALDREIESGSSLESLQLAYQIKCIWRQRPEFWMTFNRTMPIGSVTRDAYMSFSWRMAMMVVESFEGIPDIEEVEHWLEHEFDNWLTYGKLRYAYRSFSVYLMSYRLSIKNNFLDPLIPFQFQENPDDSSIDVSEEAYELAVNEFEMPITNEGIVRSWFRSDLADEEWLSSFPESERKSLAEAWKNHKAQETRVIPTPLLKHDEPTDFEKPDGIEMFPRKVRVKRETLRTLRVITDMAIKADKAIDPSKVRLNSGESVAS